MRKHVLTFAAAALLAACGGGDNVEAEHTLKLGDSVSAELLVGGDLVERTVYRLYAVNTNGELVTTQENLVDKFFIPIRVAQTGPVKDKLGKAAPVMSESELVGFFNQLWRSIAKRYGVAAPSMVAKSVYELDIPIDEIYERYAHSGLDLAAFVDFYATLDDVPFFAADDTADNDLNTFLDLANITPSEFLNTLTSMQTTWPDLLKSMADQGDDFERLLGLYRLSGSSVHDLIAGYLGKTLPDRDGFRRKADGAKIAADAAKLGFDVVKFGWDVIKDGRVSTQAEGAYSRVLSSKDAAWENYVGGTKSASAPFQYVVTDSIIKSWKLVDTKFGLSGVYGARTANVGGYWIPMMSMFVDYVNATWPVRVNAKATITLPINVGSAAEPVPEVPVFFEVNAGWLFQNFHNKYTFVANGMSGFSYRYGR